MVTAVSRLLLLHCVFFFQAEDGIRDIGVTGVQTCALPISSARASGRTTASTRRTRPGSVRSSPPRSEERRVGKECRSRRTPDDKKYHTGLDSAKCVRELHKTRTVLNQCEHNDELLDHDSHS